MTVNPIHMQGIKQDGYSVEVGSWPDHSVSQSYLHGQP